MYGDGANAANAQARERPPSPEGGDEATISQPSDSTPSSAATGEIDDKPIETNLIAKFRAVGSASRAYTSRFTESHKKNPGAFAPGLVVSTDRSAIRSNG